MGETKEPEPEFDFDQKNILDINGDVDYAKVYRLYLNDFDSLPVILQLGDLTLKDISLIPNKEEYHEIFYKCFFEEFYDRLEKLSSYWIVNGEIETSCRYLYSFPWIFDIADFIYQNFSDAEDDDELSDTEFLKKYAKHVRGILSDFETILTVYAKNYQFHHETDLNISFIASAIVSEWRLDWKSWAKWQKAIKEV